MSEKFRWGNTDDRVRPLDSGAVMARGSLTFKQGDVTRAVRAVVAAGVEIARVEVDEEGRIIVVAGKPTPDEGRGANEWDSVLGERDGTDKTSAR
jgi:hypothetical protein